MRAGPPEPREIAALPGTGGIDKTAVFDEKNTFAGRAGDKAKLVAVRAQYRISLNERIFLHLQEPRGKPNVVFINVNETGPPAAFAALFAFRRNFRHGRIY